MCILEVHFVTLPVTCNWSGSWKKPVPVDDSFPVDSRCHIITIHHWPLHDKLVSIAARNMLSYFIDTRSHRTAVRYVGAGKMCNEDVHTWLRTCIYICPYVYARGGIRCDGTPTGKYFAHVPPGTFLHTRRILLCNVLLEKRRKGCLPNHSLALFCICKSVDDTYSMRTRTKSRDLKSWIRKVVVNEWTISLLVHRDRMNVKCTQAYSHVCCDDGIWWENFNEISKR